jgi:hypothetical protein
MPQDNRKAEDLTVEALVAVWPKRPEMVVVTAGRVTSR